MSAFHEAVAAIDAGDVAKLRTLLAANPALVHERLDEPAEGYFAHPYLLWFVAENPVRNDRLPHNIAEVTRTILEAGAAREQLDYALALVASGRVPREAGVQLALIDLLIAAGANPDAAMNAALAHKEVAAAARLLDRGARLTLLAAVCLERVEEARRLLAEADRDERQLALAGAAFYGLAEPVKMLIAAGTDVSAYGPSGFHAHATPLHQAVFAGSLDAVRALVEAGANVGMTDRAHHATPLGWAEYCHQPAIADYLRGLRSA